MSKKILILTFNLWYALHLLWGRPVYCGIIKDGGSLQVDFRLCHSRENSHAKVSLLIVNTSSSHQSPDLIFMFSEGSITPLQLIPYCALCTEPIKQGIPGVPGGSCDKSHAKTIELLQKHSSVDNSKQSLFPTVPSSRSK